MSVRHEWYQSEAKVVITVLLKNAAEKNYAVTIKRESVCVTADNYELNLPLFRPVNAEKSSHVATASKVEISLVKEVGERWESLEQQAPKTSDGPPPLHKKDWDGLARALEKSEEEEPQSEEALQKLFKKIYSSASPDMQKAMNKSFSESGGTVLSTNWQEVSKDTVEVRPPEGAEFKKWSSTS